MSIAGFKSQNHPQQTGKRGARDHVDDRGTKAELFDPLHRRFGFTLDVAAAPHNAKVSDYLTRDDDGLSVPWLTPGGDVARVWCNPPYSDLGAWVRKAWAEWDDGHCDVIVMLLPANRTEQGWWQDYVEPVLRERLPIFHVEFLRGRPRFDQPPGWVTPPKGDRPPFGCCLLIWSTP